MLCFIFVFKEFQEKINTETRVRYQLSKNPGQIPVFMRVMHKE